MSLVVGQPRKFSEAELALIRRLLSQIAEPPSYAADLQSMLVQQMNDGRMGSVRLCSKHADRQFDRVVAEGEFRDADGTPVFVAINEDQYGELFEVDVWKADFSPLIRIPEASQIEIKPRTHTGFAARSLRP